MLHPGFYLILGMVIVAAIWVAVSFIFDFVSYGTYIWIPVIGFGVYVLLTRNFVKNPNSENNELGGAN